MLTVVWMGMIGAATFVQDLTAADADPGAAMCRLVEIEGTVEIRPKDDARWFVATTNTVLSGGDLIRTKENSRATIRLSDLTTQRMNERSYFPVPEEEDGVIQGFLRGILYFFHRDEPGRYDLRTPRVSAVVRGTEFAIQVDEDGTTLLTLFDGEVVLTNAFGSLRMTSGQEAVVRPDQPPVLTGVAAIGRLQWCLYYPGILHLEELPLTEESIAALRQSLDAYRAGDVQGALALYPADRLPATDAERLYRAAVLLAVGRVDGAMELIEAVAQADPSQTGEVLRRLAQALRRLIAAMTRTAQSRVFEPVLATEWMAESYALQSEGHLEEALVAARAALDKAPSFGFAMARAAEMEFSFARTDRARDLVEESLRVSPRNAQAQALLGFLLAAQNRIADAWAAFDQAIALDGALGNAWLGRGLCKIRSGQRGNGLDDLQIAATLEPQRALLRSYLGKSYSDRGDNRRAMQEIELAMKLDGEDPTAWLYAALVLRQENRVNQAIEHLEQAQSLNENRGLYRSRLLLDQDRAVRSANLANVYADAGLDEVSVREAARGVNEQYANYSGHLFLANSYSQRQDPGRISLRFESAATTEYLLANLLSPAGAGVLSPTVSQQEYSKLFESQGLGLVSDTTYLSRGAWDQRSALYGTYGGTEFSVDQRYLNDNGQWRNGDLELEIYSARIKQQLTPKDWVLAQVLWSQSEAGDLTPYYDPDQASPDRRVEETQEPIVLAGYTHEWSPGNQTLFLASRLEDTLHVEDPFQQVYYVDQATGSGALDYRVGQVYESELEIYSAEAQQILERGSHTVIAGGLYQFGEFETENQHTVVPGYFLFNIDPDDLYREGDADFHRGSVYGYYQWEVVEPLRLVAGVSYDQLKYPLNHRYAPVTEEEETTDQVSPKAGLVWTPSRWATVRAAYARGLGGVSFDQSFRLEPTQVAGINQAFRSVIPEGVAGASAAESIDIYGLSLDLEFPTRTYAGFSAGLLESDVDREIGVYDFTLVPIGGGASVPGTVPGQTRQSIDYFEPSLSVALHQLLSEEWSLGASYRLSYADLEWRYQDIPNSTNVPSRFHAEGYLHEARFFALLNHPSGFFAKGESLWLQQSNQGDTSHLAGDDFWQFNAYAGYRFFRRHAEVSVGLLNVTDQDYNLSPVNLYPSLPRDRTLAMRLRFNF